MMLLMLERGEQSPTLCQNAQQMQNICFNYNCAAFFFFFFARVQQGWNGLGNLSSSHSKERLGDKKCKFKESRGGTREHLNARERKNRKKQTPFYYCEVWKKYLDL